MKFFCLILLLGPLRSLATTDSLPYGTVIYSMIKPDIFLPGNPSWMLMDGCDTTISRKIYGDPYYNLNKFRGSGLHTEAGVEEMPDARGMFIRGMNLDRSTKTGDADGNRDRGKTQGDQFGNHKHGGGNHGHPWVGSMTLDSWGGNVMVGGNGGGGAKAVPASGDIILPEGGDETRPRNIALYIYIKVN